MCVDKQGALPYPKSMVDRSWKRAERKHAEDVGTQRIPITGRDKNEPDFSTRLHCYQHKLRKVLPAYIFEWLDGIREVARKKGRVGVLVLNLPGRRRSEAVVVLRWADWVAVAKKLDYELPAEGAQE